MGSVSRNIWAGNLASTLLICALVVSQTSAKSSNIAAGEECQNPEDYYPLIADLNLSSDEQQLLPRLCLSSSTIVSVRSANVTWSAPHNCVPDGVDCEKVDWCDQGGVCSTVCKRGSVVVDPWLDYALRFQRDLSRQQPLCLAQLLGTHNSGITAADGYGNRDEVFQRYLAFMKWVDSDATLRTNNQWLSITDQMNLGVRVVELDTHWVKGSLRVAHCGGLHLKRVNELIRMFNVLAKIFRHPIQWDSETVGCSPCLSSIRASEQRTLKDAFQEIAAWMQLDGNQDEFLVLFFDDQNNLRQWGKVPDLVDTVTSVFDPEVIVTPQEFKKLMKGVWPSINALVSMGKRLLLVSGRDYGEDMYSLIFPRSHMGCGWHEPDPESFDGPPECRFTIAPKQGSTPGAHTNGTRRLTRVSSCELLYGPLNCDFDPSPQRMALDSMTLPAFAQCGVNVPSPDGFTPHRAASQVWAWAENHPFWAPDASCQEAAGAQAARCIHPAESHAAAKQLQGPAYGLSESLGSSQLHQGKDTLGLISRVSRKLMGSTGSDQEGGQDGAAACVVISSEDGRWRRVSCDQGLPTACRLMPDALDPDQPLWWLVHPPKPYGSCPPGYAFVIPLAPQENLQLQQLLLQAGEGAAFIALQGPDFVMGSLSNSGMKQQDVAV